MSLEQTRVAISVCQAVVGATLGSMTKVYQQCWEKNGLAGVYEMVYQTIPFLFLNKLIIWFTYLGLDWLCAPLLLSFSYLFF